jgi:hypothetical protein
MTSAGRIEGDASPDGRSVVKFAEREIFHSRVPQDTGTDGSDHPESWEIAYNPISIDRTQLDRVRTLVPDNYRGTPSWWSVRSNDQEHAGGIDASAAIMLMKEHHPQKSRASNGLEPEKELK